MRTVCQWAVLLMVAGATGGAAEVDVSTLRTFGTMGKQVRVLGDQKEAELFAYRGRGCLTHMWFGGSFKGFERTRIRVYVDHERKPSIDMELFLGHGIGFADPHAPWGIARFDTAGEKSSWRGYGRSGSRSARDAGSTSSPLLPRPPLRLRLPPCSAGRRSRELPSVRSKSTNVPRSVIRSRPRGYSPRFDGNP